jgi:hypothetical protein
VIVSVPAIPEPGTARPSHFAEQRFIWLFVALIAFLLLVPILQYARELIDPEVPMVFETLLFTALLGTVMFSISTGRAWKVLTVVLAIPAAILWLVPSPFVPEWVKVVRHLLAILFLIYGIVSILRLIFSTHRVNLDLLFASLCVYLLLGVTWALTYSMIETVAPGSFYSSLPEGKFPAYLQMDSGNTAETLYFSFTTLTTLGYGDIMPTSRLTRLLAALEALVGQLYLTVLVARLMGLHLADLETRLDRDLPEK